MKLSFRSLVLLEPGLMIVLQLHQMKTAVMSNIIRAAAEGARVNICAVTRH